MEFRLLLLATIVILVGSCYGTAYGYTPTSTILPAYQVSQLPTQNDFTAKSQQELLADYPHYTVLRNNGEKVDGYFLYNGIQKDFIMIFYFQDGTDASLQNYVPYNSDYFGLRLKSDLGDERYIYSERNGKGCMFPVEHLNDYWQGKFSGCGSGATIIKKTTTGWAVYVKFFTNVPNLLEHRYYISWVYGDIEQVSHNVPKQEGFQWPESGYAKISPMYTSKPSPLIANSGNIGIKDFLYKPWDILTQGLQKNGFPCASDILKVSTDLTNYNQTYHVARITAAINSEVPPSTLYLTIYDSDNDVAKKDTQNPVDNKVVFLEDLSNMRDGYYKATVQYGTNGPESSYQFAIGKNKVSNPDSSQCYFFLLYNKSTKNLSFVANVKDTTNNYLDHLQIFVDRNGDGINDINSDDISYVIDKNKFGPYILGANGTWSKLQDTKFADNGQGRMKILDDSYQVLVTIPNVSENFRFALEQDDYSDSSEQITRYPQGSFATVSSTWAPSTIQNLSPARLVSDIWEPDEITSSQDVQVNLILVGNNWNDTTKAKIQSRLASYYSPIISSKMSLAGIQYSYTYNFVTIPDKQSNGLFDFMKSNAEDVKPFYGENDFDAPWGLALWIQNNHTEWVDKFSKTYHIGYKLIDGDKMQDYIQKNIISNDPSLTKPNSANLVFISDSQDKINFLHNYKLKRYDSASKAEHTAVGLMGFGGKYNFYFFDLYAAPWSDTYGLPALYDKKLDSYATDMIDLKSQDGFVQLVTDYTNNATSLIIDPSYIYPPTYKNHYTLDLTIIHKPAGTIGSLNSVIDYYIDQGQVKSKLQELMPYTSWDIKTTLENQDSKNLPDDLKSAIQNIKTIVPYQNLPSYSVDMLYSQDVAKAVTGWSSTSTSVAENDLENFDKTAFTMPAVEVISSSHNPIFIDTMGEDGVATENPKNPTDPCCAIGVTYNDAVWTDKVSMTRLVLHEVGHTLGLMHPFMGYAQDGHFYQNNYFNWYDSVMAYNGPPNGCTIWYGQAIAKDPIDKTCGISDTTFTKFERENLSRGVANYLIQTAKANIYKIMLNLEENGQDPNNPPVDIKNTLNNIQQNIAQAQGSFEVNDISSDQGAIHYGLLAAQQSSDLLKTPMQDSIIPSSAYKIPSWVKNNAKWWHEGSIGDDDFVKGIQYLVQQDIIHVNKTIPSQGVQHVPSWVKNLAGMWTDNQVTDDDFLKGIQYLVQVGIIKT